VRRPQTILVTGASSGIGRAVALEAAHRGHRVFASARKPASIEDLSSAPGVATLTLDVTEAGAAARAVGQVLAREGHLDALVSNAGYGQYGAVEDVPLEDWRRQFEVNVFGAVDAARAVLPVMRKARSGTIVFVSSVAGKISIPFAGPYCASKHALEAIADALRVEVAPFGIRVVIVEPGPIDTRFDERARSEIADLLGQPGPYSYFYPNAVRAMDTDFQMGKLPASAAARVIVDAIESKRPKTRYRLTIMARLFLPLRQLLSDRFFDRRMKKALRLPDRV
jgi:NAD(P)-dependent dehydrogenase (short-subunit alcohol dehydrogenase family)